MEPSEADVLLHARDLVAEGWVKGYEGARVAENGNVMAVPPTSEDAEMWCLRGAVRRAAFVATGDPIHVTRFNRWVRAALLRMGWKKPIQRFNDQHATKEQVLDVLDCAARLAKDAD